MNSFDETRDLLREAQSGEHRPLERLIEKHRDKLLAGVRDLIGPTVRNHVDSEDLVQELFVDIVRAFEPGRFQTEEQFLGWARHVARNNVRDAARRGYVRSMERLATSILGPAQSEGPHTRAARAELLERLDRTLEQLDEELRTVIELRDMGGLPWAEVAQRLGRPSADAARVLHARALARLTTLLRRESR